MNRRIDFTQAGGLFIYQDTLDFLQTAYAQPLDAVAAAVGDKVILSGAIDQGATVTAGWIVYNGEVLPFTGGLKANYIVVEQITDVEQFDDTQQRTVYYTRRLKFGNAPGTDGGFLYSELKKFPFKSSSINSALSTIQTVLKGIVNFENEVILDGCTVSNVVGSNMQVSAGVIMFAGDVVVSPAYSGSFPAYIQDNGAWTTVEPANGLYVKFDPHTSQRYRDVLRRFNHQSGDIIMSKVLSDRFDAATGSGKWEWLGFKLSADMQGRVPIGYWFGANGATNVYDAGYRVIGAIGGGNKHTLTVQELPKFNPRGDVSSSGGSGGSLLYTRGGASIGKWTGDEIGGGQSHENRQPYKVVAFIERV